MDIQKTNNSSYTVNIANEKKEFASFEDAEMYLKKIGLSHEEIENALRSEKQSTITRVSTKFSLTPIKKNTNSIHTCPHCQKRIPNNPKKCPYCFKDINTSFFKRIFGIE